MQRERVSRCTERKHFQTCIGNANVSFISRSNSPAQSHPRRTACLSVSHAASTASSRNTGTAPGQSSSVQCSPASAAVTLEHPDWPQAVLHSGTLTVFAYIRPGNLQAGNHQPKADYVKYTALNITQLFSSHFGS